MQKIARVPTAPPSSGALTKKPLPMIEASGVTVAFQREEVDSFFESARYPTKRIATAMMTMLIILVKLFQWRQLDAFVVVRSAERTATIIPNT